MVILGHNFSEQDHSNRLNYLIVQWSHQYITLHGMNAREEKTFGAQELLWL